MVRDTALTKKKLLEAAREEFAALGVAGARVDRIAERAGVNKERVYGHFGNKEGLFAEVISTALDELAESVAKPTGDIGTWVESVYEFHRDRPELLRLLMWEALHAPNRELPGERNRAARYSVKVDALAERLGLAPGPEAAAVLLSLIGLAAWPSAVPQLARQIVGPQVQTRHVQDVIRSTITTLASRAVTDNHNPEPGSD